MAQVGFEPTIPVFERAKTVHALDRAVTAIGNISKYKPNLMQNVDRMVRNTFFETIEIL
jgi:hypothetical protein